MLSLASIQPAWTEHHDSVTARGQLCEVVYISHQEKPYVYTSGNIANSKFLNKSLMAEKKPFLHDSNSPTLSLSHSKAHEMLHSWLKGQRPGVAPLQTPTRARQNAGAPRPEKEMLRGDSLYQEAPGLDEQPSHKYPSTLTTKGPAGNKTKTLQPLVEGTSSVDQVLQFSMDKWSASRIKQFSSPICLLWHSSLKEKMILKRNHFYVWVLWGGHWFTTTVLKL